MDSIFILGSNHHNTLSIVRAVGEAGYAPDVLLYGCNDSFVAKSRYPKSVSFYTSANEAIQSLKDNDKGGIVISTSDNDVALLNEEFDFLKNRYNFFNCGRSELIRKYMDKNTQMILADKCELVIPKILNKSNLDRRGGIIIKPLKSIEGGKHLEICHSYEELAAALNKFDQGEVLIQEYLQKEYEIVLVGLSCGGEVYIPAYILKHRESAGGTTYSSVRLLTDSERVIVESSKKLVKEIGYEGLFGIEFIYANGKYYFIEINLRNDATTYSICKAGVNLPEAYIKYCEGKEYRDILCTPVREIDSIVEFRDFGNARKQGVRLLKWLVQYKNSECKYFYSKEDIEPFKYQLRLFINGYRNGAKNKIHKIMHW